MSEGNPIKKAGKIDSKLRKLNMYKDAASHNRIKAGCGMEKAAGQASGPVKKTGAPGAVFRCLFRPVHAACFRPPVERRLAC